LLGVEDELHIGNSKDYQAFGDFRQDALTLNHNTPVEVFSLLFREGYFCEGVFGRLREDLSSEHVRKLNELKIDSIDKLLAINSKSINRLGAVANVYLVEIRECQVYVFEQLREILADVGLPSDQLYPLDEKRFFQFVLGNLSTRSYNSLKTEQIDDLEGFMALDERTIMQMRNLGKKSWTEIEHYQKLIEQITGKSLNTGQVQNNKGEKEVSTELGSRWDFRIDSEAGLRLFEVIKHTVGTRLRNALDDLQIETLKEFLSFPVKRILEAKGLGRRTSQELRDFQAYAIEHPCPVRAQPTMRIRFRGVFTYKGYRTC